MVARAVWRAPGRVTLIGDHTDYSGGWVLPFALTLGTTVTVRLTLTGTLSVRSSHYGDTAHRRPLDALTPGASGWAAYVEGAVHLMRSEGARLDGVDVDVSSDLPVGSGLASSAALVCGTLGALSDVTGVTMTRTQLAELAQRVENEFVGAPVGFMDPAVVMHGETDHALLIDCAARDISSVPLRLADAGLTCLVVDTGEAHATAGPTYARRVTECRDAARLLGVPSLRHVTDVDALHQLDDVLRRRAQHVVTENARVLSAAAALRRGDFASLGELMRASHASLRDDYEVSTPALDRVVATATASGALGARLTGAGMGGCALVLVEVGRERDVRDAVAGAFAAAGAVEPTTYSVTAGSGAHRVRASHA